MFSLFIFQNLIKKDIFNLDIRIHKIYSHVNCALFGLNTLNFNQIWVTANHYIIRSHDNEMAY
jgi:hypothetical protein